MKKNKLETANKRAVNWRVEHFIELCDSYCDGLETIYLYRPGVKIYDGDMLFATHRRTVVVPLTTAQEMALEMEEETKRKLKTIKRRVKPGIISE